MALLVLLLFAAGLHQRTPEKLPQVGADGGVSQFISTGKKERKPDKMFHVDRMDKEMQMVAASCWEVRRVSQ